MIKMQLTKRLICDSVLTYFNLTFCIKLKVIVLHHLLFNTFLRILTFDPKIWKKKKKEFQIFALNLLLLKLKITKQNKTVEF